MKVLLDTHILLWLWYSPEKIHKEILEVLENRKNEIFVSSVSYTEVIIKSSIGKLYLTPSTEAFIDSVSKAEGYQALSFTVNHAKKLLSIPISHKDPFDRMLIAQALTQDFVLATMDKDIIALAKRVKGLRVI